MTPQEESKGTKLKIGSVRTRSTPNRIFGWALFWIATLTVVMNWVEEFSELDVLPGGHSPFYLVGGIAAAAVGLWRAGVMDAKT